MVKEPPPPPRREKTLDFCNGWKWSHPPETPRLFLVHVALSLAGQFPGGGRFHGEGTRVVLVLICSFHSNYPEPFQALRRGSPG